MKVGLGRSNTLGPYLSWHQLYCREEPRTFDPEVLGQLYLAVSFQSCVNTLILSPVGG